MLVSIPGVSEERAIAIVKRYPTFKVLIRSYEDLKNDDDRANLLMLIPTEKSMIKGSTERGIGKAVSARVFRALTSTEPSELV